MSTADEPSSPAKATPNTQATPQAKRPGRGTGPRGAKKRGGGKPPDPAKVPGANKQPGATEQPGPANPPDTAKGLTPAKEPAPANGTTAGVRGRASGRGVGVAPPQHTASEPGEGTPRAQATPERAGAGGSPERRRGRRPAGQDTRNALLEAARAVFAEAGYDGATVRTIAARAGVDAAMVNHWFGGKESLFAQAVLKLPFDPKDVVATLLEGDLDSLGERIIRRFVRVWDSTSGSTFPALVRSLASHDQAATSLRNFLIEQILSRVMSALESDHPQLRAALCASQLIGIGMARYVAQFEPLGHADPETIVAAVAPTLQRYLTGDLGSPSSN